MHTVTLKKRRGDIYCLSYDDERTSKQEALREVGRWASNPTLSFTWFDAAIMSQRIREHRTDDRFSNWQTLVVE